MDIQEFIEAIKVEFEKEEQAQVQAEMPFRDVSSWNSMMALILIAKIDNDFDVTLSADELAAAQTFQDLYQLVAEKLSK